MRKRFGQSWLSVSGDCFEIWKTGVIVWISADCSCVDGCGHLA